MAQEARARKRVAVETVAAFNLVHEAMELAREVRSGGVGACWWYA